jgi:hypothetical protein
VTTGNNNIHIANAGTSADDALIRIGGTQTATFIAGIRGVTTGANDALAVLIDSNGQLGTTNSSRRVKTDIHDLPASPLTCPAEDKIQPLSTPAARRLREAMLALAFSTSRGRFHFRVWSYRGRCGPRSSSSSGPRPGRFCGSAQAARPTQALPKKRR